MRTFNLCMHGCVATRQVQIPKFTVTVRTEIGIRTRTLILMSMAARDIE